MKRIFALTLIIALLLCGCAGDQSQLDTTAAADGTTEASTEAATEASTEATSEATGETADGTEAATDATESTDATDAAEEATEPTTGGEVLYRNPLNGTPLDAPYTSRVTTFVINNLKACLPQHGVSAADILYEVETEGGITRHLAVFSDLTGLEKIGPIRSARTFFNAISLSYDAPIVHCGGSEPGLAGYADKYVTRISGWEHINEAYNGGYFFRDRERYRNGYAWEHTLFTSGAKISSALSDRGYAKTYEDGNDFGLLFAEEPFLDGPGANTVTVKFKGGKTTTFTYNAEEKLYDTAEYDRAYVDGNTGETVQFRNVIVIYTNHTKKSDSHYLRSFYDLKGSGDGHMFCDGKLIPIRWSHSDYREPFAYTTVDGQPLTLGVGHTYVAVTSTSAPLSFS